MLLIPALIALSLGLSSNVPMAWLREGDAHGAKIA